MIMSKEFNIVKKPSPNITKGRNGWKPDMIVSHITEGGFNGAVSWLCNPNSGVSAHFVVAKDGKITQLVELTDTAKANGTSVDLKGKNPKMHYSLSTLSKVKDRKTNANYYTISIEHEGFSSEANGRLEPKQLEASIWLHKYIIQEVKRIYRIDIPLDRNHIVGHYQINPVTKPFCPGKNFQFDEILNSLKNDKVGELIKMELAKWQEEMGIKSLDSLSKKKDNSGNPIVNSPDTWKENLAENVPQWLFWSIIDRISK
jgi:N-acetyl-anhydromuramyl-L-alanine amidase AmpD